MTPSAGLLTDLLNLFRGVFNTSITKLTTPALSILGMLVVIDLTLVTLMNLGNSNQIKQLVTKTFRYAFVVWLVGNYKTIITWILGGFRWVGLHAVSDSISTGIIGSPSAILAIGTNLSSSIFEYVKDHQSLATLPECLFFLLCGLLIWFCFLFMAIQLFITFVEFYMVGGLALILVPFGANKFTSFIAQKAGNAVFSFGVKIMVLCFVLAVSVTKMQTWTLDLTSSASLDDMMSPILYTLAGAATLAFLAWHAPAMAAGFMSGMPSMSASNVAGAALATGATVMGAGKAIGAAGNSVRKGSRTAGGLREAAAIGAAQNDGAGKFKGALAGMSQYAKESSSFAAGRRDAQEKLTGKSAARRYKPVSNSTPPNGGGGKTASGSGSGSGVDLNSNPKGGKNDTDNKA